MNIEKERERFEAWFLKHHGSMGVDRDMLFKLTPQGGYYGNLVSHSYYAWQAAKADEMTEARCREILGCNEVPFNFSHDVDGLIENEKLFSADRSCEWSVEQLKAIIWWMENKA